MQFILVPLDVFRQNVDLRFERLRIFKDGLDDIPDVSLPLGTLHRPEGGAFFADGPHDVEVGHFAHGRCRLSAALISLAGAALASASFGSAHSAA